MTTSEIVAPAVEVAPVREYTDDEKNQLAKIVASELYKGFVENLEIEAVVMSSRAVIGGLDWFQLEQNLFPQLEKIGIRGIFDFPLKLKVRFYFKACFPGKFHRWMFQLKTPSLEKYLEVFVRPDVVFTKPTEDTFSTSWDSEINRKRHLGVKPGNWSKFQIGPKK